MPRERTKAKLYFARGESGGKNSRFKLRPVTEPAPRDEAELVAGHPALVEGRTIFTSHVFDAGDRDRVLIEGMNNSKIGNRVTKGPWAGFPIFTFALEERATCPRSCHLFSACYGNALPMAVRFKFNDGFLMSMEEELVMAGDKHPNGFAVRAHVLGDFVNLEYVRHWELWMRLVPQLHVWGYTAHQAGTEIGDAVYAMNHVFAGRWAFRNSVAPESEHDEWQASTTWEKPTKVGGALRGGGGLICPAEMGATATCGLCWSPAAKDTRIVFLGHGMRRPKRERKIPTEPPAPRPVIYAPVAKRDPSLDDMVRRAVEYGAVTRLPPKEKRR